jgi:hypothetical protein
MTSGIETFAICVNLVGIVAFVAVELLGRGKRRHKEIDPPSFITEWRRQSAARDRMKNPPV